MKTIAIIPARGGSKRFPRKNIALLKGAPLFTYPLKAAMSSNIFNSVYVSTEDEEISNIATKHGAQIHARSDQYATDTAHELEAVRELLDSLDDLPDFVCILYPTAIFIENNDLVKSYELIKSAPDTESIMCVSNFNYHPYKALKTNENSYLEMMFPEECKSRSQTYPHLVASNGTFYWLKVSALMKNPEKSYYQDHLKAYEIPYERAVDIDYPEDLAYAETLLNSKGAS